jgi:hypothetical protein
MDSYTGEACSFNKITGVDDDDIDGVVIRKKGDEYFKRNIGDDVDIKWFGAIGNGIANDLPAFQSANEYCRANGTGLFLSSGIYRITGQWIAGWKYIDEEDIEIGEEIYSAPSYSAVEFTKSAEGKRYRIYGENAVIHGDFVAADLTAVVYYGMCNRGTSGGAYQINDFTGISIYGRTSYDDGVFTELTVRDATSNQVGVCIPMGIGLLMDGVNVFNFKQGILSSNCYFSKTSRVRAKLCQIGFKLYMTNATIMEGLTSEDCDTGMELQGDTMQLINFSTEQCKVDIYVPQSNNLTIIGGYLENVHAGDTLFGIQLGNTDGSGYCLFTKLIGVRQNRAGNKGIYMYANSNYNAFSNCRTYSDEVRIQSALHCKVDYCDFTPVGSIEYLVVVNYDSSANKYTAAEVVATEVTSGEINNSGDVNVDGYVRANGDVLISNVGNGISYPAWLAYQLVNDYYVRDTTNSRSAFRLIAGAANLGQAIFDGTITASGTGTNSMAGALDVAGNIKSSTGDIEAFTNTKGFVLKSPNGSRWRITVDNAGALATTAL